ncbi:major facilitator superfamily transporter [Moniliophthora roreri]|nr:major facilitator superfamily transporter [Moniliophthora roreri]
MLWMPFRRVILPAKDIFFASECWFSTYTVPAPLVPRSYGSNISTVAVVTYGASGEFKGIVMMGLVNARSKSLLACPSHHHESGQQNFKQRMSVVQHTVHGDSFTGQSGLGLG